MTAPASVARPPTRLRVDPRPVLLAAADPALTWAVGHDLDGKQMDPRELWNTPTALAILRRQRDDGSWAYPGGGRSQSEEDYAQLQTFKQLLVLVSRYRLHTGHPGLVAGASFLLAHQAAEGDIRGIYGSQYTPNYTAAMLELMVEAGMGDDPGVTRGLDWLLAIRQDDGGWVIPLRTLPGRQGTAYARAMAMREPVMPDRVRPSSHMVTGIVLRALAAHPHYRHRPETRRAAALLVSRIGEADRYPDRRDPAFWHKLQFPFRWTDVVSSLDALGLIRVDAGLQGVASAIRWLRDNQGADGRWHSAYRSGADPMAHEWVTFAAARALRRLGVSW